MNKNIIIGLTGIVFGFGLGLSTMSQQEVVLSFIKLQDLGLLLVMGFAILVTFVAFYLYPKKHKRSVSGDKFALFQIVKNKQLLIGAVLFGIGWGISGICPGSAIASLGTGNFPILLGILGMALGGLVNDAILVKIWNKI